MSENFFVKHHNLAPVFIRFGLAAVFLVFGLQKLADPSQSTPEVQLLSGLELADAAAFNFYVGIFEIFIAISFIFGFKVRIASVIATLLMSTFFAFNIKESLTLNPEIYRDLGLIGGSVALFILGAGPFSIDQRPRAKAEVAQNSASTTITE